MTTVLVAGGFALVLAAVSIGFVGWRDRRRLSLADDGTADRTAQADRQRHDADRHGEQGRMWDGVHGP